MIEKYPPHIEHQMQVFYSKLKEREQRHYAAVEAQKLGHGGKKYIQLLFNIHQKTLKEQADEKRIQRHPTHPGATVCITKRKRCLSSLC